MSNQVVFYIGLAVVGFSLLIAVVAIPLFLFSGRRIKKQLEADYGKEGYKNQIKR